MVADKVYLDLYQACLNLSLFIYSCFLFIYLLQGLLMQQISLSLVYLFEVYSINSIASVAL